MKKKLIIALAAALVLCCAGVGAWAASNAGTQSDPLVAMSYLEQVQQRLERNFDAALDEAVDGLDALLATVQMPSGIPVATVTLNGAKNAAVLAAQILAVEDAALAEKLDAARARMAEQIAEKEAALQAELYGQ